MAVEVVLGMVATGLRARAPSRPNPAAGPAYRVGELPAVLHWAFAFRRSTHGAQSCPRYAPPHRLGPYIALMAHDGNPDPAVSDETMLEEIDLVADLVVAVSKAERHLSQAEIDQALGLEDDQPNRPEM